MALCVPGGECKDAVPQSPPRRESGITKLGPGEMVAAIMFVFVIAILGAAFTGPLQGQVNNWTANNQSSAATVVSLIPLLFWILLAVGIILVVVGSFLPEQGGLGPKSAAPELMSRSSESLFKPLELERAPEESLARRGMERHDVAGPPVTAALVPS